MLQAVRPVQADQRIPAPVVCRGVRGAILVASNTADDILEATQTLLSELVEANDIAPEDVASVIFTTTPDLNAAFPARAARLLGWNDVALLGAVEIDHPEAPGRCIRVLLHWNTTRRPNEIRNLYLRGADILRASPVCQGPAPTKPLMIPGVGPAARPDLPANTLKGANTMLVVMRMGATQRQIDQVVAHVTALGCTPHLAPGEERMCIGLLGANVRDVDADEFNAMQGVERVVRVLKPYKLASRDFHPADTTINVRGTVIGGKRVVMIAGPCSVESRAQTLEVAAQLQAMGVTILRGGAYKPRTSPYAFQGLGEAALDILAEVRERYNMAIITEVMAPEEVPTVARVADILQIGTRNMQNYRLLEAVGRQDRPVLLKRGMSSTVEELLLAAEYILNLGNSQVMLCERGIRTFEQSTRYTFDVNAIPVLKGLTHLPIIADPSHGTGRSDLVPPISRAAVAAGADGLIVEVHPRPEEALSDGPQSLRPGEAGELIHSLRAIAAAIGREM